jgi:hypothetical protein
MRHVKSDREVEMKRRLLAGLLVASVIVLIVELVQERRFRHDSIKEEQGWMPVGEKPGERGWRSERVSLEAPAGYEIGISRGWDRKGPNATISVHHGEVTSAGVRLATVELKPEEFISGMSRIFGHPELKSITVADFTEVPGPFPCSHVYVDNLDQDADQEVFIYQSGRPNRRMEPIPSGAYCLDFDDQTGKWFLKRYSRLDAFWRVGGWKAFLLKGGLIGLTLVLIIAITGNKPSRSHAREDSADA